MFADFLIALLGAANTVTISHPERDLLGRFSDMHRARVLVNIGEADTRTSRP